MKKLVTILALSLASLCAAPRSHATSIEDEIAAMKQRIDALEIENRSLREAVLEKGANNEPVVGPEFETSGSEVETKSEFEPKISELEAELSASGSEECLSCEESQKNDLAMSASWHHGLELTTKDKDFRVHVGGRTQFDVGWFAAPDNVQDNINNPYLDGADFRRGRLRIDGTMYGTMDWAVEYDFFNSVNDSGDPHAVTGPTDLWWTFREVPWVGNVRVGNQKPAIGFEHLVSSRFLPFMERSYNQDAFYGGLFNGFQPGVSLFDNWGDEDLGTWNVGVFKPTDNVFAYNVGNDDWKLVSRLTRLLWYENEGECLLHVGGSIAALNPMDDRQIFRTRDAIRTGLSTELPVPASTGPIATDNVQWLNGELVAVNGPWTFQSEALVNLVQDASPVVGNVVQPSVGTVMYHGYYAQVLYYLTDDHDIYNKATGTFDRVIPKRNFILRRGCVASGPGAWQIGVRYNHLDLNDSGIDGGVLNNVTCGLNWFWNPNFKVQFNYMATHRDAALAGDLGDGWISGWGVRFAHDF